MKLYKNYFQIFYFTQNKDLFKFQVGCRHQLYYHLFLLHSEIFDHGIIIMMK